MYITTNKTRTKKTKKNVITNINQNIYRLTRLYLTDQTEATGRRGDGFHLMRRFGRKVKWRMQIMVTAACFSLLFFFKEK